MLNFQRVKTRVLQKLQSFSIEHGQFPTINLTIDIDFLPLLALLKGQNISNQEPSILPTIYWKNKENTLTLASFGAIEELDHIPAATNDAFYLGGLAFQQQGEQWAGFPAIHFIRPRLLFQETNQQQQVICHFNGTNSVADSIEVVQALQYPEPLLPLNNQLLKRQDSPNQQQWTALVELAIECKALLPKVVLSRETKLHFKDPLNAWDIIGLWQQANFNSFHYLLQFSAQNCFISCSPERLFSRHNRDITTEALAGTVNRGRNQREDDLLLESLLHDKKIDRENHLVQEFIIASLKQLKAEVKCASAQVLQLQHVQHLCVPIKAILAESTQDCDLLYKLHPTPAVGGTPKLPALQFINDNEPHHRGWYAGAVGYISENKSDFSVAIRSALINENHIKLFAGAGIVTGSIADQEWQELDNKIQTILTILSEQ